MRVGSFGRNAAAHAVLPRDLGSGCLAIGGDHARRELPANAVQPPGASFEHEISAAQKAMLLRDTLRATVAEVAHRPVRSTVAGARRLAERVGVRLAESVPVTAHPARPPVPRGRRPLHPGADHAALRQPPGLSRPCST